MLDGKPSTCNCKSATWLHDFWKRFRHDLPSDPRVAGKYEPAQHHDDEVCVACKAVVAAEGGR